MDGLEVSKEGLGGAKVPLCACEKRFSRRSLHAFTALQQVVPEQNRAQRKINGDTHNSSRACLGRTSRPQCLLTLP